MFSNNYNLMKATSSTGDVIGFSKDGSPIRAAYASGEEIGFMKDGTPVRSTNVIDTMVCGGSSILFVVVGLGIGFLATERFATYLSNKKS